MRNLPRFTLTNENDCDNINAKEGEKMYRGLQNVIVIQ